MPMTVDGIQIEINAQVVRANDALDKLSTKLSTLESALGRLDASKLVSFGNAVNRVAQSMQSMKNVTLPDFNRLAKGIDKIAQLDAATIGRAASSMHRLNNALEGLKKIDVSTTSTQVTNLAKGISQLGYKSASQAIDNIPKLAQGLSQMMKTLSKAPRVSQNLIDMTNALAKLARTGASSGRAAASLGKSLDTYTSSTSRASKGTFSLSSAIGKLYATYWLLFRAFGKITDSIDLASSLTEVQNVVNTTFGDYAELLERMSDTSITDFGMSELTTKQVASRFQAMGTAMGFSQGKMADMSIELTKLTADMASFYNVEQSAVAEDLSAIFTGETRPLREYGLDLTQATLAEWAMKQGIDADIKSMSQAEKTMLRYQYVLANTSAAQGDFARTANTWANQTRILKQNLEALGIVMGKTLINALKPLVTALNNAMSHIIAFAETVSNALGKIFGWQFEVTTGGGIADEMADASDYSDDLASGLGSASDKAKKLKSYLLGIDELNVLEPDTDTDSGTGGGGGGSVGGAAAAEGGQWTRTETIWENFESEIDSLFKLGDYIGNTLTNMLNNIDWNKVYGGARNFGKGLADFLNGLISPELFGAVGRTIAGALNTAIYAALDFGKTFDFYKFGESIATGINEFFNTFDFAALVQTINTWAKGIKDTILGFLDTITWESVIKGAKNFLGELSLDTIEVAIGAFALKYANNVLTSGVLRGTLVGKFTALITSAFGTGALGLGANAAAGFTIAATIYVGFKFLEDYKDWKQHIEEEGEYAGRRNFAAENPNNPYLGTQETIDWFKNVPSGIELLTGQTPEQLLEASGYVERINTQMQEQQTQVENVRAAWDTIGTAVKTAWEDAKTAFDGFKNHVGGDGSTSSWGLGIPDLKAGIQQAWEEVQAWWNETIVTWWNGSVMPWFSAETWYEVLDGIKQGFATKWSELVDWWNNSAIVTWWTENVQPWFTAEKWQTELNNVKEAFSTKWNETVVQWKNGIQTWWTEHVQPWFTKDRWLTLGENLKNGIYEGFKGLANNVVDVLNRVISSFEGMINSAINGINSLLSKLNESGIGEFLGFDFHVGSVSIGRIPRFAEGGFPEQSSLFYAGENGVPELLGTVGGRTAVAGGDEITGIREAVYETGQGEMALLETAVTLLQIIADKETSFELDGRELVTALNERQNRGGFSFA